MLIGKEAFKGGCEQSSVELGWTCHQEVGCKCRYGAKPHGNPFVKQQFAFDGTPWSPHLK